MPRWRPIVYDACATQSLDAVQRRLRSSLLADIVVS